VSGVKRGICCRVLAACSKDLALHLVLFVVNLYYSRCGSPSCTGEKTRPYRFGEFDLLGVCLHPSTGNWTDFVYTVANWLLPDPDWPGHMLKYQPVSTKESDGWTRDFELCVPWFRTGDRRRICQEEQVYG
jgi:hypothetical protein